MPIYHHSVSRYGLKDHENKSQITDHVFLRSISFGILLHHFHLSWKNLLVLKQDRSMTLEQPRKVLRFTQNDRKSIQAQLILDS